MKKAKRFSFWSLAILILAGSAWGTVKFGANPQNSSASLLMAVSDSDRTKGDTNAPVTLVEYSDFQCSACGAYYPLLKKAGAELGVRFVYRHFPLTQIHANAESAARAAEAAGRQGKFWEMHDMIFERQSEWSKENGAREIFSGYARLLGLDAETFRRDFDSREVADKVTADYRGGLESGVNATPTLFLNGKKIQNPRNYDELKSLIIAEKNL